MIPSEIWMELIKEIDENGDGEVILLIKFKQKSNYII